MTRKALVVGIDDYSHPAISNLNGCENDAKLFAETIECHGDGSKNFAIRVLEDGVTSGVLLREVNQLFEGDADTVVFYFAGHGVFDESADFGFLVTEDGTNPAWGVNLDTILGLANSAYPRIKSTVIILDCCHSGQIGLPGLRNGGGYATIGKGVTIMTACSKDEVAMEYEGQGLFTSILINGLNGQAADILGNITPASLYSHVDRTLGEFEQRPLYKANVQAFTNLKEVDSPISEADLRKLPVFFKKPSDIYPLGPECEPHEDRGNLAEKFKDIPFNEAASEKYQLLQKFNKIGLVEAHEQPFMWHAALNATGCKLTKVGQHYHYLASKGKFGRVGKG